MPRLRGGASRATSQQAIGFGLDDVSFLGEHPTRSGLHQEPWVERFAGMRESSTEPAGSSLLRLIPSQLLFFSRRAPRLPAVLPPSRYGESDQG
jgi:hypothetical protein